VYLPDTSSSEIRNTLKLVGWETKGCALESKTHNYGTDFGNPEENSQRYSNLTYSVTLARPVSYFLLKMLLPLIVVMLVSIGGLLLHPSAQEAAHRVRHPPCPTRWAISILAALLPRQSETAPSPARD
jgi:hypothetical protein